ncbi:MAG TPA: hypothetical protein VG367_04055 [Mucilaginibacter sp.]|jgi:hypothetical protein|nr:hypothetical protein [Mucilaginibacter sp.]
MKKAIYIPVIAGLFFFACKREHSSSVSPSAKKYKVSFHIANFTQKQTNFALRHGAHTLALGDTITNLASYFNVLYLQVYRLDIPVNSLVVQDSTMANMGMITDSLPAGNYVVDVIAGKKGLTLTRYNLRDFEGLFGYGGLNWQDTFWATAKITVGSTDMSQDVTLNRVVGKIRLHILDNIPANADSLAMTIAPETNVMFFDRGYNEGEPPSNTTRIAVKIPQSAKGHPDFILDKIVGNSFDPFSVSITCTDASNNVIAHTSVDNVRTGGNIVSVLSGNLFGSTSGSGPQSFTVKVDTAWSTTINQAGF